MAVIDILILISSFSSQLKNFTFYLFVPNILHYPGNRIGETKNCNFFIGKRLYEYWKEQIKKIKKGNETATLALETDYINSERQRDTRRINKMTNRGYVSGKGNNAQATICRWEVIKWAEIGVEIAKLIMDGMSTAHGRLGGR